MEQGDFLQSQGGEIVGLGWAAHADRALFHETVENIFL